VRRGRSVNGSCVKYVSFSTITVPRRKIERVQSQLKDLQFQKDEHFHKREFLEPTWGVLEYHIMDPWKKIECASLQIILID
jgi:hypothetical protein